MSYPTARHQKPLRRSPAGLGLYDEVPYHDGPYQVAVCDEPRYGDAPYGDAPYDASYGDASYQEVPFEQAFYDRALHHQVRYERALYNQAPYQQTRYDQAADQWARYDQALHDQTPHDQALHDQAWHDDGRHDRRASGGPRKPRKPGAHRHARPSRMRRKPVRIAAAMAGSTLLVAGAAPMAAHWYRLATHPTGLDRSSPPSTAAAALGSGPQTPGQPAAPQNALDQWAQIPIGKHAAAQASTAKRAARHAAAQPSHSPQPTATASAAYQNPLRAVSGLVLERVDMGVDFGGAGPVYALGDGVITNATGDSSGWPGGGWITYQLTDGPDAGLVVYVAEDVTPTVEVGQKVTSSTVIANMFNGGDGIETGWATSDGSTAESQMAAAGGISGGGPFPTMVGLSFDAVLESVGVPAAPNANEPGNGLLPPGYPAVAD